MAAERKTAAQVVPLFPTFAAVQVADEVSVGRTLVHRAAPDVAKEAGIDLSDKPKVLLAIGAGNVGKTSILRWVAERAVAANRQTFFAAIDPENRELSNYFEGVHEPASFEPNAVLSWLEKFLAFAMDNKATAAIDVGGGDTSLGRLVASTPDIVQMAEDAGVAIVALYPLAPRLSDLSAMETLEKAGFQPKATAIVLNEGRADPTVPREEAFARTMQHSAYKAAIARGAQQVWMPRLIPAKEVEDRRITYADARDATPKKGVVPLGPFDRRRVGQWLLRMEAEFGGISTWLP
nr:hypothetical protein [uncultured Rhodopila sp.]